MTKLVKLQPGSQDDDDAARRVLFILRTRSTGILQLPHSYYSERPAGRSTLGGFSLMNQSRAKPPRNFSVFGNQVVHLVLTSVLQLVFERRALDRQQIS